MKRIWNRIRFILSVVVALILLCIVILLLMDSNWLHAVLNTLYGISSSGIISNYRYALGFLFMYCMLGRPFIYVSNYLEKHKEESPKTTKWKIMCAVMVIYILSFLVLLAMKFF